MEENIDELYNRFFEDDKQFIGRCFRKRDNYIWHKDEAYEAINYYIDTGIEP
jgi:hypothetical protein